MSATPRVVSLVPSASETLVALGVTPIACTRFCELPDVPTIGGTKNPDIAAIIELAPDLVVVNDEENRWDDAAALIDAGLAVHSMSPRSVHDVGAEVRTLAERLDVPVPIPFERRRLGRVAGVGAHAALVRRVRRGVAPARGCRWRATPTARRCSTCWASATCSPTRSTGTPKSRSRRSPPGRRT